VAARLSQHVNSWCLCVGLHIHSHCTTPCYITSVNGAVCVNPFPGSAAARRIFAAFSTLRPEFTLRVVHVQFVMNIIVLVTISLRIRRLFLASSHSTGAPQSLFCPGFGKCGSLKVAFLQKNSPPKWKTFPFCYQHCWLGNASRLCCVQWISVKKTLLAYI